MQHPPPSRLLDRYPLIRARSAEDASAQIGRVLSPHTLQVLDRARELDVYHNQLCMRDVSLNSLTYGCDVVIEAGERGDFFLVQLPLSGTALVKSGSDEVHSDPTVLTVLQPRAHSRMVWSADCAMLLLKVPRHVVEQRALASGAGALRIALSRPRTDPDVAAWWQAVIDLARNLDQHGQSWMRHPAAYGAMEEFLLSAFTSMLCVEPPALAAWAGEARCVRKAKDYIRAHLDRALRVGEIARDACVSPRALEAAFKRQGEGSPLAYARRLRLQAVHEQLLAASRQGLVCSVTEVAMRHGFVHMGRFAAHYRAQFGCAPSDTLRLH